MNAPFVTSHKSTPFCTLAVTCACAMVAPPKLGLVVRVTVPFVGLPSEMSLKLTGLEKNFENLYKLFCTNCLFENTKYIWNVC